MSAAAAVAADGTGESCGRHGSASSFASVAPTEHAARKQGRVNLIMVASDHTMECNLLVRQSFSMGPPVQRTTGSTAAPSIPTTHPLPIRLLPPPTPTSTHARPSSVPRRLSRTTGVWPHTTAAGAWDGLFFDRFRDSYPPPPLRACFPCPKFIWSTPARRPGGPSRRPRSEPFAPSRPPRGAASPHLGRFQSPSCRPIRRLADDSQPANHPLSSSSAHPRAVQAGRNARHARRGLGCGAVPARNASHDVVSRWP